MMPIVIRGTARVINVSNPNSISLAAEVLFTTSGNANAISVTSGRRGDPSNSSVMTIAWYDSSVNNAGEFLAMELLVLEAIKFHLRVMVLFKEAQMDS